MYGIDLVFVEWMSLSYVIGKPGHSVILTTGLTQAVSQYSVLILSPVNDNESKNALDRTW